MSREANVEVAAGMAPSHSASVGNSQFVPKKLPQYLAALAGTVGAFGLGNVLGWSSSGMVSMEKSGDFGDFKADSEEASWVASIATLGALAACLTLGFPLEIIGRKWTMLALSIPFMAGWLIMGFGSSIAMILVGRFITGYTGGAFTLVYPIYVSEIAEDNIRGILGNVMNVILCAGILFTYSIAVGLSWDIVCFVCAGVPVILLIGVFFIPESPRYLLSKGKEVEALNSLRRLRGAQFDAQVENEMKLIRTSVEESKAQSVSFKDLLAWPILKPVLISMVLMFLQQFGGINAVLFFAENIFKAAKTDLQSNVQSVIIAGVQVAFVIVSTLLVERLGRKILLTISDLGMGLSLVALGTFFYLQKNEPTTANNLGWLPLTSLVLYIVTYNLGLGPLPWTIMGELIPPHVKSLASSIASAFNWSLAFVITKSFPSMQDAMEPYGCYWLFSAISLAGSAFCILIVPETKGRSLDEIQALFK